MDVLVKTTHSGHKLTVFAETRKVGSIYYFNTPEDIDRVRGMRLIGFQLCSPVTNANLALWRQLRPVLEAGLAQPEPSPPAADEVGPFLTI